MTYRVAFSCVTILMCGCFVRAPPYQGPFAHWMLVEATATANDPSAPSQELSRRDYKEIAVVVPAVQKVIPARLGTAVVETAEGREIEVEVSGSTPEMIDLLYEDNQALVVAGRFLQDADRSTTAVMTQELANQLFPSDDPLGKSLRIGSHDLEIVGIVKYGEKSWTGRTHASVFVPQAVFDSMHESLALRSQSEIDQIWISTPDLLRVVESQRKVERILEKNHPGQSFEVQVGMRPERSKP